MKLKLMIACLTLLNVGSLCAEDQVVEDHTIIVVEEPVRSTPVVVSNASTAAAASTEHGATIDRIYHDPNQIFVDSEFGPMPLFAEVNTDGSLHIPQGFVRELAADPTPEKAALYLEQRRVSARRYLQISQIMRDTAAELGYVVASDFTPPKTPSSHSRDLAEPVGVADESLGVPAMGPQQALAAGLKEDDLPVIPGRTTARYVEVLYIWDHRCPYSKAGFRDFAVVGRQAYERQLGPRFMTISMDNDPAAVQAQLDWFDWRWQQDKDKASTRWVENRTDLTNLRESMHIARTPTYIFIDRRTGKMTRMEGQKSAQAISESLMALVGHGDANWSEADPRWFRPVKPAVGAGEDTAGTEATDTSEQKPIPGSSPLMKRSREIRSWDPDNISD